MKNTETKNTNGAAVGCSALLDRVGFMVYPHGSREEKRIRDEIHRRTVAWLISTSRINLSQFEAEALCRYTTARPQLWSVGVTHLGAGRRPVCQELRARIAWRLDTLYSRLYRIGCTGVILLHRVWRRLESFWRRSSWCVERSNDQAERRRKGNP
jgi:hypothetical protein